MSDNAAMMSQRAFARHIGRSVGYVNKLVKQGVIPLHGPKRKIDPVEAIAAIEAAKDPTRDAQREANERRRSEPDIFDSSMLPAESIADMTEEEREEYDRRLREERERFESIRSRAKEQGIDMAEETDGMTLNEVKIFKELYLGKMAQLEFRRKSGDLVDKEAVVREASEEAHRVRSSLLALPHKLSVRIASMNDPVEIEALLDGEIRQVLEELSGGETNE